MSKTLSQKISQAKYMSTEEGKLARRRAQSKYYETHKKKLYTQKESQRIARISVTLPDTHICEICGKDVSMVETEIWHTNSRHKQLCAHHWKGYNFPLDVWWVCYRCNRLLTKHDGSMNKEQAIVYIKSQCHFTDGQLYENYLTENSKKSAWKTYGDYSI